MENSNSFAYIVLRLRRDDDNILGSEPINRKC